MLDPTGEMGDPCDGDAGEIVDAARERATRLGWDVPALKTGKVRRASGSGDYPTALMYPVTAVGRKLATRGPLRVIARVAAAGGYETAPGSATTSNCGLTSCPSSGADGPSRRIRFHCRERVYSEMAAGI